MQQNRNTTKDGKRSIHQKSGKFTNFYLNLGWTKYTSHLNFWKDTTFDLAVVRQLLVSEFEQKVQQGYSFAAGEAWSCGRSLESCLGFQELSLAEAFQVSELF
jgi:hypothetical protein